METKTCSKCCAQKPATPDHFPVKNKTLKSGERRQYLYSACSDCGREREKLRIQLSRKYAPQKHRDQRKRLRSTPEGRAKRLASERDRRARREGFQSHAEKIESQQRCDALNRLAGAITRLAKARKKSTQPTPWNALGITSGEKYRLRYRLDAEFNLKERLRRQITKRAKRDGVADMMRVSLRRGRESNAVLRLVGYTIAELKTHLERQFTDGMTWKRFIAGDIHIDHITPQADFDLQDDYDWRACWSLGNLRPLWGNDNLAKSSAKHFLL